MFPQWEDLLKSQVQTNVGNQLNYSRIPSLFNNAQFFYSRDIFLFSSNITGKQHWLNLINSHITNKSCEKNKWKYAIQIWAEPLQTVSKAHTAWPQLTNSFSLTVLRPPICNVSYDRVILLKSQEFGPITDCESNFLNSWQTICETF